jgi:hypothetical protein
MYKLTLAIFGSRAQSQGAFQLQMFSALVSQPVWDTGVVLSSSQQLEYAGGALLASTIYSWRVRVASSSNRSALGIFSTNATFITGVQDPSLWKAAEWITGKGIVRQEIRSLPVGLKSCDLAHLEVVVHAAALGYYYLRLNGREIPGEDVVLSGAGGRSQFEIAVPYDTYDVSHIVSAAIRNSGEIGAGAGAGADEGVGVEPMLVIGAELGKGYWGHFRYGPPALKLLLLARCTSHGTDASTNTSASASMPELPPAYLLTSSDANWTTARVNTWM